jgi:hypothetical protein
MGKFESSLLGIRLQLIHHNQLDTLPGVTHLTDPDNTRGRLPLHRRDGLDPGPFLRKRKEDRIGRKQESDSKQRSENKRHWNLQATSNFNNVLYLFQYVKRYFSRC